MAADHSAFVYSRASSANGADAGRGSSFAAMLPPCCRVADRAGAFGSRSRRLPRALPAGQVSRHIASGRGEARQRGASLAVVACRRYTRSGGDLGPRRSAKRRGGDVRAGRGGAPTADPEQRPAALASLASLAASGSAGRDNGPQEGRRRAAK